MVELVNKIAKGSLIIFISKLVDAIVAVVFSVLLARMLGVNTYGFIASTIGVATVLGLFAKLGITEATAKYVSEHLAKREKQKLKNIIQSAVLIETLLGLLTAFFCFIFAEPLAVIIFNKPTLVTPFRIISGMIFFIAISNIFTGIFLGYYRMELFVTASIIGQIVRLITSITLVWFGYGLVGAILGFVVGSAVNSIIGLMLFIIIIYPSIPKRTSKPLPIRAGLSKLIHFGLPLVVLGGMMIIYQWTDTLCLTVFTEVKYISWYNIAFGMVAMTMVFSQTLNTTFFPIVSELNAKKKHQTLLKAYHLLIKILAHITNILIIGMIALSPQIIILLYGAEYLPAAYPFLILAVWGLIRPFGILSGAIPIGMGKTKINAKVAVLTAGSNLILNLILIPFYGMIGAAIATTTSYILGTVVLLNITSKLLNSSISWGPIIKSFIAAAISSVFIFGITSGILGLLVSIIISFSIGLLIYLLILFLLKTFTKEDLNILKGLDVPMKKYLIRIIVRLSR